ncbi:mitochondrial preribosomal assembly protein rimM precursor, putative [Plasmodium yoelii]|uniref:Mitochondrial preribosomal assembly protein rimM, putative n=1 Tax=Plasmodium yoelii TaxID=5861 RepID=A0A077Y0Y4_PLAYE|nr:mitochondrial preribosomal assembly protein rimM precursor, putative [Plasmodium yoelii]
MIKCFGKLRGIIILFSFFLFAEKGVNSLAWNKISKMASSPLIRDIPFLNGYKKNEGKQIYTKRDIPYTETYQYTNQVENKSRKDTKRNLFFFFLKNNTLSHLNKIKVRNKTFSSHHTISNRNIFAKNQKKIITMHAYSSDEKNDINNGSIKNGDIKNGDINNGSIKNGDIKNGDIKNGDIKNGDINNGGIKNGDIKNGGIKNGDIKNGDIKNGDINNGGIKNGDIKNGDIKNGDIKNGDINNGSIKNGDIKNGDINNGSIKNGDIKNGDIKNGDINNGSIKNGDIKNGGIKNGGIKNGGIKNGDIKNGDIKNGGIKNGGIKEISKIDTSQNPIIDKENNILPNEDKEEERNKKRQFLTDTKYYKRSKYSKAGKINIKNNLDNTIYDNNQLFSNIIQNDDNILTYVESLEDLKNLKKKNNNINASNNNLPDLLIKNYYADSMRPNDLDFIKKNNYLENNISTTNHSQTSQIKNVEKNIGKNINKNNISFINEFSVIGEIVGVHGLQGCLKVVSFTTFNDIRFKENSYRYIFMNSYPYPIPIKITYVKESLKIGFLYIKIEKIYSRTDALRLKGCLICDDKKNFPDIGENKYISTDLINFDIYIFNDSTNIPIGTVFSFVSKYDYICNKAVQDISEDLIKIELNQNVSINKIFNILKASQASENTQNLRKKHAPIKVLINRKNFNLYQTEEKITEEKITEEKITEEKITEENFDTNESDKIKGDKNYYNSLENFEGYSYKKIYKCDFCDDIYDNLREATKHENSHFQHDEEILFHSSDANTNKESLYELTENELKNIKKKINYFFVPIIKEKTIRLVHYEHKKIYLDISTIFLLDNPK